MKQYRQLSGELIGFNARTGMPVQAAAGVGCPPCSINFGGSGCTPCEETQASLPECQGCFTSKGFFSKHDIWPAVVSGVIIAIATGVTLTVLKKQGLKLST